VAESAPWTLARIETWTEAELAQQVNAALKQFNSVLALARSPLAETHLVTPLLVLDDVSPTAGERGQALRLVLQWAVEQLAPGPVAYPLGEYRPLDDPTWRDPLWWRYNILRHRYLEPLHPDEFIEGGRATETLLALTGIPSPDTFFDERNRAIREVAQWLRQQLATRQADDALRELALAEAYRPLLAQPAAGALLDIAATFPEVFPRGLLLQLAAVERIQEAEAALDYLTQQRFLQVGEEAQNLWLAPVLRRFLYARQPRSALPGRHRRAAAYYSAEAEPLTAARHLIWGQRWQDAAALLLESAEDLVDELQAGDLIQVLEEIRPGSLAPDQQRAVQVLLGDLYRAVGRQADALAACRAALKVTDAPEQQARIYRRMGKLYEQHNQLHALGYYEQAAARFRAGDPEYVELLKDRAWLYILRKQWDEAEADLRQALALVPTEERDLRADIDDALASLYRNQRRYEQAIAYARAALVLRDETGDLLRVAKSFNNLGLIYNDMGDYAHAIAAYQEAIATYTKLGNQELVAVALLNVGLAHHLDGRLPAAVQAYRECLTLCQSAGAPLAEVRAHSNLAEALAELGQIAAARGHWETGLDLSLRAGFDDEVAYFRQLHDQTPALQAGAAPYAQADTRHAPSQGPPPDALAPADQALVDLARREGKLTPRRVMDALSISKATATRRLSELAAQGHLRRFGEGRGTYYATAAEDAAPAPPDGIARRTPDRDALDLRGRLYQHSARIQSIPGLSALGIVEADGPARLAARFSAAPDLMAFFRLESELSRLLGQPIDLLPDTALAIYSEDVTAVTWVWQRQDFQG
jgi:tetratricopeptide (TPR) repeat protein